MFQILRSLQNVKNLTDKPYHSNNISFNKEFNLFYYKNLYFYYLKDVVYTFKNKARTNEFLIQNRSVLDLNGGDLFFSRDMNTILFDTSEYSDTEMLLIFGKKFTDENLMVRNHTL